MANVNTNKNKRNLTQTTNQTTEPQGTETEQEQTFESMTNTEKGMYLLKVEKVSQWDNLTEAKAWLEQSQGYLNPLTIGLGYLNPDPQVLDSVLSVEDSSYIGLEFKTRYKTGENSNKIPDGVSLTVSIRTGITDDTRRGVRDVMFLKPSDLTSPMLSFALTMLLRETNNNIREAASIWFNRGMEDSFQEYILPTKKRKRRSKTAIDQTVPLTDSETVDDSFIGDDQTVESDEDSTD